MANKENILPIEFEMYSQKQLAMYYDLETLNEYPQYRAMEEGCEQSIEFDENYQGELFTFKPLQPINELL